ncbi:MAG: hydrolase [Planctomycetes bacterium]|nr:hydrolase [Planctomycetota bacterium]
MTPDEIAQRAAVVAAARSWLGTPYHHHARVKGVGADCLTLLASVYAEAGVIPPVRIPEYSHQWHLHRSEELYLNGVLEHAREISGPPEPGDTVVWKFGRCYSHGAVVVVWPLVIHAYIGIGTVLEDAEKAGWLSHIGENTEDRGKPRPRKFFSCWGA